MVMVIPKIRPATKDDVLEISDLSAQLGYPASAEQSMSRLGALLELTDNAVFVAVQDDGRVVGWAHVFVAFRVESDAFSELGGLVVAEQHRGGGIGTALVAASGAWARKRGILKLRVRCRSERSDAHAFYSHLGFRLTKKQHIYDQALPTKPL